MRSGWERLLAEYLDRRGYDWDYEPFSISLPDGSAYVPDFVLPPDNCIFEVKGYMTADGERKIQQARLMGYHVVIFDQKALKRLGILTSSGLKKYRDEFASTTSKPNRKTSSSGAF